MAGTFGNGAVLQMGLTTTTTVSEINNIKLPGFDSKEIDVTTHNNTTRFKDYIKGLIDAGTMKIDGNMNYTDYGTIYAAAVTTSMYTITITVPTSPSVTKWTCQGFIKGLDCEAPAEDKIKFSADIKITGKPTLTQV
jgi:hypothetical protein